ncbi:MAG TPA: DUF397 domain-containing protein [Streptosporangiaceae bacterium]|nr:DUF397 domain-containing protein [Streptosporangiaceae bacterium]
MANPAFRFTLEARTEDRRMSAQPPDRSLPAWRKSTCSETGNCVEVAVFHSRVLVRDSRDPARVVLPVEPGRWCEFIGRVKAAGSARVPTAWL